VGIAVLIAVTPRLGHLLTPTWLRIAAPTAVAVAFTGYIVAIDPTLNLRTPVWETFLSQWMASPLTGVGATGIQAAINDGSLQAWANHGHSLVIDPMARYGVIGLLAVAAVLATTGIIATKAASAGFAAPAVLLAAFIAAGVSDTLVDWRYLGVQAVPILLAALLGAALLTQKRIEAPSRRP
jgi:O-antigen ligase